MNRVDQPVAKADVAAEHPSPEPLLGGSSTPVLSIANAAPAVMNQALNPTKYAETTRTTPPEYEAPGAGHGQPWSRRPLSEAPHAAAPMKLAAPTPMR